MCRAHKISAFTAPSCIYLYPVMRFGLHKAPVTFQQLMNRVVSGLVGSTVYLEDVVVYADTGEHAFSHTHCA